MASSQHGAWPQVQRPAYLPPRPPQPQHGALDSYVNPHQDVPSWWSVFLRGGFSWRWFGSPQLYFRPGLEYVPQAPFSVIDGFGRETTYDKPIECQINPFTGKIDTLYVQTPHSICLMSSTNPNCTWKRTPVRTVTPIMLRIANLPFMWIPRGRRHDKSLYTVEDWSSVVGMWIPTVAVFLLALLSYESIDPPDGKDETKYLPMMCGDLRYPRLARNLMENRGEVATRLRHHPAWDTSGLGTYRTFRPRFLNYLLKKEHNGVWIYKSERRPVPPDDMTPYIVVAYASSHYRITDDPDSAATDRGDLEALLSIATKAAARFFNVKPDDEDQKAVAFWVSANCMPPCREVDGSGQVRVIDNSTEAGKTRQDELASQDTYSISDIVRGAQHVAIAAGNMRRDWDDNALRVWGERVWTLPEVVLSRSETVTVWHCGRRLVPGEQPPRWALDVQVRDIPKTLFPTYAWKDPLRTRQLIEHYGNLRLSRLELVKIALDCLMSRKFRAMHAGDRVYVLMGLLRIRPPIDSSDTSFQAFARLSLPQDSDRLMERLICLLPDRPEQSWELMRDQYRASLWDIYPETQVCAIGENDTVVVDGARGAQIQWDQFTRVRTLRRLTLKRWIFLKLVVWSPLLFVVGAVVAALSAPRYTTVTTAFTGSVLYVSGDPVAYAAGLVILIPTLLLLVLPAPYFLWHLFAGKFWEVEPCLFGIEGYVPLEVIEEKLFGTHSNRMSWSAWGSPLSRHRQGKALHERAVRYPADDSHSDSDSEHGGGVDPSPLLPRQQADKRQQRQQDQPSVSAIHTYPVETIDPCAPCDACAGQGGRYCRFHPTPASCQDRSRSPMGQTKVFTLVDTFNMTATLFYAVRPPTVLIMGGTEGGMKRAIACSFDITTGTLYRETVLRMPSQSADRMESLPRIRLGLRRPFLDTDVRRIQPNLGYVAPGPRAPAPSASQEAINMQTFHAKY